MQVVGNNSSLYVGDLHPDVTEAMLFDAFKSVGQVASLRVCRDAVTRRSLGYAYINFHNSADAERALDTLNHSPIRGKPCRIMWSHRDPSLRRAGTGNIFIKNMDKSIDNKALYDTFSAFGNILSCKVATDELGNSRGFGFVHYETGEAAQQAIAKVNGMLLKDKIVFVGPFVGKRERPGEGGFGGSRGAQKFTNIYVKNLDPNTKAEQLKQLFERFGPITSCVIMTDNATGASRGFGFVNFETPEAAKTAVDEMNGQMLDTKVVFVGRAQKKAERDAELRAKFEQLKAERLAKEAGVNLYVKNLDETVDDARLKQEFSQYGTITSAKVMRDDKTKVSKGFGFVCFSTPEEATKAVTEMNSKMVGGKPIYVALAQRKDVRRAQLESYHRAQANLARAGFTPNSAVYAMNPVFYPPQGRGGAAAAGGGGAGGAGGGYVPYGAPQQMVPRGRWTGPAGQPGQPQGGARPQQPGYGNYVLPVSQRRGGGGGGGGGGRQNRPAPPGGRGPPQGQPGAPMGQPGMPPAGVAAPGVASGVPPPADARGFKWTPDARNKEAAPPAGAGVGTELPPANATAEAPSQAARKQLLGEQLFPQIYAVQPKDAPKITGMLLESMGVPELLELLESPVMLHARINEAVTVLQQAANAPASGSAAVEM